MRELTRFGAARTGCCERLEDSAGTMRKADRTQYEGANRMIGDRERFAVPGRLAVVVGTGQPSRGSLRRGAAYVDPAEAMCLESSRPATAR
jgi:hypothetical protein